MSAKIKTYHTAEFRDKFLDRSPRVDSLFKQNFENFFCLKIEDVKNHTKFPVPPSKENCHTIIFITAGIYKHFVGFSKVTAVKDEVICTAAGQIFSIDEIPEDTTGFTCHFHPNILVGKFGKNDLLNQYQFLKVWGKPHIPLGNTNSKFVNNIFSRLHFEYSANGIKNLEIIQAYLFALIVEINTCYQSESKEIYSASNIIAKKFKELLFSSKAQHKVSEYAEQLNITPNHLNKCVKGATGKSPAKWITETVVTEAKYLLYQTDLTINEIAIEVGHFDQSYFTRLFKKIEGITPHEYRKLIEKS
ncbi:MAG: helix-turn-helix domain-containing protein [Chitinophagaceae bacterium]